MVTKPLFLLGLTGEPGSGKDSVAQALQAHGYVSIAFADALRQEIAAAWRIDARMLQHRPTKEWPVPALAVGMCGDRDFLLWAHGLELDLHEPRSARWVLQTWGTDYRRGESGADYWTRVVDRWIDGCMGLGKRCLIVTDVRMANEASLIRRRGGKVLRVVRPAHLVSLSSDTAGHASEREAAALQVDGVIRNDGSFEALAGAAGQAVVEAFGVGAMVRRAAA